MGENDQEKIIAEFKEKRTRQVIISVILITIAILLEILRYYKISFFPYSLIIIIIFGITVIIYSGHNWRCPSCNNYLGNKSLNPKFCANCKVKLQN